MSLGGKGLGRFTWLKAFERVEIESTFAEADAKDHLFHRSFIFDENYEPDIARPVPVTDSTSRGTSVKLSGFKEPYQGACPKTTDQIVQRIVEHFLLIFLEPDCPELTVEDFGLLSSVNDVFERDFRSLATTTPLQGRVGRFHAHRLSAFDTPCIEA